MSKDEWKKWVSVAGRMLLAYALVFVQGAWATQNQATKDKSASPQKAAAQQANGKQSAAPTTPVAQNKQAQGEESESAVAEEKPSNDASHQGIKVHGHWSIEVRNLDGALVTHREFENSFFKGSGNQILSQIFARQLTVGLWAINLGGSVGPCVFSATGAQTNCLIEEPNPAFPGPPFFGTLNISVNSNNNFVLSGQAIAGINGDVSDVSTSLTTCAPTVAPASCATLGGNLFITGAVASASNPGFSAPIPVQAGQTIAVTVVISFS